MSGKIIKLFLVVMILLLCLANSFSQTKIEKIEARLFYQNTGTFSEDIFSKPSDLWNVYLDYVYSVFITVEVTGKYDGRQIDNPKRIEFSAIYKPFEGTKKEISFIKTSPVWFNEKGKSIVGFWFDNVGCEPMKITVKLKGQKQILRKTINFGCGE